MASEVAEYISTIDTKCRNEFSDILNRMQDGVPVWVLECMTHDGVADLFDRYKVWSANVGAAHSGVRYKRSLDYRLREAPFYKSTALKVLHRLHDVLLAINRLTTVQHRVDDNDSVYAEDQTGRDDELSTDVDADWAISDSSSDSDRDTVQQAPKSGSERLPLRLVQDFDEQSQLESSLDSLKFAITCLYKLPVRNLAPITRLKSSNQGIFGDSSLFQYFDTMFVQDLFPLCDKQISIRLGRLITRRRYLLHYRQAYNLKLQNETAESASVQALTTDRPNTSVIGIESSRQQSADTETLARAESSIIQTTIKASTFNPVLAPKVDINFLAPAPPSEADTSTSVATTRTGQEMLPLPPRPKDSRGQELEDFECPYCGLAVHIKLTTHSWKKHLFQDIEPYVCVGVDCDGHEDTYSDRDKWFEHQVRHFYRYHCGNLDHQSFNERSAFQHHMSQTHKITLPAADLKSAVGLFLKPIDLRSSLICPLCKEETQQIKHHLSRHLERIALFAIPRVVAADHDDEFRSQHANVSREASDNSRSGSSPLSSFSEVQDQSALQTDSRDRTAPVEKPERNVLSTSLDSTPLIYTYDDLVDKVLFDGPIVNLRREDLTFHFQRLADGMYSISIHSKESKCTLQKHSFSVEFLLKYHQNLGYMDLGNFRFDTTKILDLLRPLPSNANSTNAIQDDEDADEMIKEGEAPDIPDIEANFSWEHVKPELGDASRSTTGLASKSLEPMEDPSLQTEHEFLEASLRFGSGSEGTRNLIFNGDQRRIHARGHAYRTLKVTHPLVYLFLLDNCLLLTKSERKQFDINKHHEYFVVQQCIPMELLQLRNQIKNGTRKLLDVASLGKELVYEFQLASEDEYATWVEAIVKAKSDYAFKTSLSIHFRFVLELLAVTPRLARVNDLEDDPTPITSTPVDNLMDLHSNAIYSEAPSVNEEIQTITSYVDATGTECFAAGTKLGIYLLGRGRQVLQYVKMDPVHQISIEDVNDWLLCLSGYSLCCFSLAELNASRALVMPHTKLSSTRRVHVVRTAYTQGRPLVFYSQRDGMGTLFRVLAAKAVTSVLPKIRPKKMAPGPGDFDEFYMSTKCRNISIFNRTISLATDLGFEVLSLDKKQPWSVPNLRSDDASTQLHLTSIAHRLKGLAALNMFRLSTSEFICCYEDCAVYVDQHGDVSRSVIMEYISRADDVAISDGFLIIFHSDFVEIRDPQNGKLSRIIEGVDIKMLDAGHDSTYPPDDKRAYKRTVKFRMRCPGQRNRFLVVGLSLPIRRDPFQEYLEMRR